MPCPWCSGTDYAHEAGEPCYYEYMREEQEREQQEEENRQLEEQRWLEENGPDGHGF